MKRTEQVVLITATLVGSWLGMQAAHELGHVLGAWLTGGRVATVVLHPLVISRTDLDVNPHPLVVAWAGPLVGVALPLLLWAAHALLRVPAAHLARFFAGFCCVANGVYLGSAPYACVGDCSTILRHGGATWQATLFGALAFPVGLGLWHCLGPSFGLGPGRGRVSRASLCVSLTICALLIVLGVFVDGR